jgi:hypothetical protein
VPQRLDLIRERMLSSFLAPEIQDIDPESFYLIRLSTSVKPTQCHCESLKIFQALQPIFHGSYKT